MSSDPTVAVDVRVLRPGDEALLINAAVGVFDHNPQVDLTAEFLRDPRHHIVAAIDAGQVVGFVSAVHYVHPDKEPELWLNEVSVAATHQNRGVGRLMIEEMLVLGRRLGCRCAWVLLIVRTCPPCGFMHRPAGSRRPRLPFSSSFNSTLPNSRLPNRIRAMPPDHRPLSATLPRHMRVLVILYFVASLAHFTHNAGYIAFYPGMPAWLTSEKVYLAWLGVASVGFAALALSSFGLPTPAVLMLGIYGAFGLDGLAHYTLALCSEHTIVANITIWSEATTGLLLLLASSAALGRRLSAAVRGSHG